MALRLSVVVPSLNQAEFLSQTLDSLVGQQGVSSDELELIVIDGGSSDGSVDIIRRYSSRLAYWVSEADRGQTHALNKGFAVATGDVLGWLYSDDLLERRTVREVLDFFALHREVEFVYGDGLWIDKTGRVLRPKKETPFSWFIWLFDHNYIPQPSAFWRRQLHEKVGGLDQRFECAMDADLWARFATVTRPRHVRRIWSRMRRYQEQKNQQLRVRSNVEDALIRQRAIGWTVSGMPLLALRAAARALRIAWKISMGCYWGLEPAHSRGLVRSEAESLLSRGSRQMAPDAVGLPPGPGDNTQQAKRDEKTMVASA
jgi:glycosyltransferase involved in cell wall biosynthesis